MARHEQHREDLLRDATALVERAEIVPDNALEPVVIGFRADGSASFYFGQDVVYHFNRRGQLRRAHVGDLLYKAESGRLSSLRRHRVAGGLELLRHDLDAAETAQFIDAARARLRGLATSLASRRYQLGGQVPEDVDVVASAGAWLSELGDEVPIARSPRVG